MERQTDTVITVLCSSIRGGVINQIELKTCVPVYKTYLYSAMSQANHQNCFMATWSPKTAKRRFSL